MPFVQTLLNIQIVPKCSNGLAQAAALGKSTARNPCQPHANCFPLHFPHTLLSLPLLSTRFCHSFNGTLKASLNTLPRRRMPPKLKDGDAVVAFSGKWIAWVHTVVAYAAFLGALITGLCLHYRKIVENEYYVCTICAWVFSLKADT